MARFRCQKAGPGCAGCERPVCAVELSRELVASQRGGEMTGRFVILALAVCTGYFSQRSWSGLPEAARDDVRSQYIDRLMNKWVDLDPQQNVHSFLTRMAIFSGLDAARQYDSQQRKMRALRDEGLLAESPGEVV